MIPYSKLLQDGLITVNEARQGLLGEKGFELYVPFKPMVIEAPTPAHPRACACCGAPWEPSCSWCGRDAWKAAPSNAPIASANPEAVNRIPR